MKAEVLIKVRMNVYVVVGGYKVEHCKIIAWLEDVDHGVEVFVTKFVLSQIWIDMA